MTFAWLDIEKPPQRPWRGLPYNRALDSGDLSWFTRARVWFTPVHGHDNDRLDDLREQMRRVYDQCTTGGTPPPTSHIVVREP